MTDYTKFYGFSKNPFDVAPDPKFFFPSEGHSEALESLRYGISNRKGFILLLGEAGIGKTILIHYLMSTLDAKIKSIHFPKSNIPFEDMLKGMLLKLHVPPGPATKGSMMHGLYYNLIQCTEKDENVAVIIDEAENIGLDVIEEVRLLANLETSTSKLLQIVLVGQPRLMEKLRSEVIRQIKQRIVITCQIKPLTEKESLQYIDHRLKIAGSGSTEVFTEESLSLICRYAHGNPLALNTLCSNALSVGCGLSEQRITDSTVKKIRREKGILTAERVSIIASRIKRNLPRKISIIFAGLVLLAVVLFFGWSYVQPLYNTLLPDHSIAPPAIRDTVKAPPPEVKSPGVAENVPVNPVPQAMVQPPEVKPHGIVENIPGKAVPQAITPQPETTKIAVSSTAVKGRSNAPISIKEIVEVKQGINLYSLAYKYFKTNEETFIDHILKVNPEITNPNLILISQKIKIPEITESLLIVQNQEGIYKIHLRTFTNSKSAGQYKRITESMRKDVAIVPWKVSAEETWYRVMAGPFANRYEAAQALEEMKQKGFSIIPERSK